MLNIIIKAIFFVIGKIGDIIFVPIMLLINAIIPDFSINFDYIFNFLVGGFNYITFFLKVLMVPPLCVQIVVLIFTTYISLQVSLRVYQFTMKIYNNFKP